MQKELTKILPAGITADVPDRAVSYDCVAFFKAKMPYEQFADRYIAADHGVFSAGTSDF